MHNIIAIVGRPNVGKSTLFNRLTAARTAIEERVPGVTRDRLYGTTEWRGKELVVIDTGGLTFGSGDGLAKRVRGQAELAIEEAGVIIFLLDGKEGLTALDQEIAVLLRRSGKIIVPVINKIDTLAMEAAKYDFYQLGFGDPLTISAAHGTGTGDLLDHILTFVGEEPDSAEESYSQDVLKVALIGRPNVGKSLLVNTVLGEERVIVSDQPGTTRDAIDTYFQFQEQPFVLIDTAGVRKKSKVKDAVEYYSVLRSLKAVQRADVALLVLDGELGITEQDQRLGGFVLEAGRGLVVAVNKWDLVRENEISKEEFLDDYKRFFSFAPFAQVVFVSALTGWRVKRLFPLLTEAWQEQHKRIPTALLNELLEDAQAVNPPAEAKGKRVRFYYATQVGIKPPTFVFFANAPELVHFSYQRYLENRIREAFGFKGTPIVLKIRKRERREG